MPTAMPDTAVTAMSVDQALPPRPELRLIEALPAVATATSGGGAATAQLDLGGHALPGAPIDWGRLRQLLDAGVKRGFDVLVSATLLLLLLPLIVLAALLIRLDSPGPVFYRSERVGFRGRTLRMLKFRKMRDDASGPALTMDDDERFTRMGPVLAKLKIDEIPQLWHVLKGEMSLVGPRPEDLELVERYAPEFRFRLEMRPGITGPMQVHGRGELTFQERVAVEREYIENYSLRKDVQILIATVAAVARGRGAF